jgi:hypothetical protein
LALLQLAITPDSAAPGCMALQEGHVLLGRRLEGAEGGRGGGVRGHGGGAGRGGSGLGLLGAGGGRGRAGRSNRRLQLRAHDCALDLLALQQPAQPGVENDLLALGTAAPV